MFGEVWVAKSHLMRLKVCSMWNDGFSALFKQLSVKLNLVCVATASYVRV